MMAKLANTLHLAHKEKRRRLSDYSGASSRYRAVNFEYDAVKAVEFLGSGETIGVEIDGLHTHVTSGIITHNTRQFQRSEICIMYGVPPILIGDTKETTAWGTGVAEINQAAVTYTFRAWTSCIESVVSNCLPGGQFVRFDYNALLRGNMQDRYGSLATGLAGGFLTANEARAGEEMDPHKGGDVLYMPKSSVPVGTPAAVSGGAPKAPVSTPGHLPMPPVGGGENFPGGNGKSPGKTGRALAEVEEIAE
jgi:hypothetical protein